jgi:hypothetical protein
MNKRSKICLTFVLVFQEGDFCQASITDGRTPAEAIEEYYLQLNAYCSPNFDEDYHEEFDVDVYYLPSIFSDDFVDGLRDLDGEELAYEIKNLARGNTSITYSVVHVTSTAEGMTFS